MAPIDRSHTSLNTCCLYTRSGHLYRHKYYSYLGRVAYINKQWINKGSVGPERLSVYDNRSFRTDNVMES